MADAHLVTVAVPPTLFARLQRRAAQTHRSVEDELVLTLAETIGEEANLPADLEATVGILPTLGDDVLWAVARGRVPDDEAERLADLADKRQHSGLSDDELREAEALVRRHDSLSLIRATAAAILKGRGRDVSPLFAHP
jgi:hypothetical protein